MNTKNALGFLVVGVLMKALPALEPSWFPLTGPDGTSAAALWLTCMGVIEAAIGGGYLLRHHVVPSLIRLGAYRAQPRTARVSWRAARNQQVS